MWTRDSMAFNNKQFIEQILLKHIVPDAGDNGSIEPSKGPAIN